MKTKLTVILCIVIILSSLISCSQSENQNTVPDSSLPINQETEKQEHATNVPEKTKPAELITTSFIGVGDNIIYGTK